MTKLCVTGNRKTAYEALEASGEAQDALWEFIATMIEEGVPAPPKLQQVLEKRQQIKERLPK